MARPTERCRGEVTTAGLGRQIGDRCKKHGAASQNYLCHLHVRQHNNPNYPTENSYRLRPGERPDHTPSTEVQSNASQARPSNRERPVDNSSITTANVEPSQQNLPQRQPALLCRSDERLHRTSQTKVQGNTSQAGPSTRQRPVDNPSRTTANDESWPSTAPQRRPASFRPQLSKIFEPSQRDSPQREPASSRSQLPTPPEQPDRRRHATPEPMTSPNRTPTQASNTVIKPIRKLMSQHTHTRQSRESNEIRYPRLQNLPFTPASPTVPPRPRQEQSRIPQPSPSTADRSLPTQDTLLPPVIRRESSEGQHSGLYNLPLTPASSIVINIHSQVERKSDDIPEPNPSFANRSQPIQDTPNSPRRDPARTESTASPSPGLSNMPPTPANPTLNDIHSQVEREQNGITEPNSSFADNNNGQNEIENQLQRTHRHDSTNTSDHSSIEGSFSTASTLSNSPPSLTPQDRSVLREKSRLVRTLSYALIDDGQITSNDSLRAVFSEQTSVPGASSILDIILDVLQGYMELRDIDEIPKGLAAKLLRTACDQGEEGERFAEQLRQWVRRGGTVDDDVVEAFGLDDFEEWMRVGEGWMTRTWGFLSSMMDLRKKKRE